MYYADQRYYRDGVGRFLSADPYRASGGPSDPASWNRYAYVSSDPVNLWDPHGLQGCPAGHICASLPDPAETFRLGWTRQRDEAQRILESTLLDARSEGRARFDEHNASIKLFVSENIMKHMTPVCEAGIARAMQAAPGRNIGPVDTKAFLVGTLNSMTFLHGGMHTVTLGDIGIGAIPELGLGPLATVDHAWVKADELNREYRMFNGFSVSAFAFRSSHTVIAMDTAAMRGVGMVHELLHIATGLSDIDLAIALEPNWRPSEPGSPFPVPGSPSAQASGVVNQFLSSCSPGGWLK